MTTTAPHATKSVSWHRDALKESTMDLRTTYLGMTLNHPFIAGASPFGYDLDAIKRLEDAGCAAVVLHSLFEEQITEMQSGHVAHMDVFDNKFRDTLATFPAAREYPLGPDEYAEHVHRAKHAVSIPVIGSLNGRTPESWLKFARVIEQAGADAIELNMYEVPADLSVPGSALEDRLVAVVRDVKRLPHDSRCRQAVAVLLGIRPPRPSARCGGRRRSGAVQSFLSTRHRHSHDDRDSRSGALDER